MRGDVLARELGLQPGPRLGELLDEIAEARFAGELVTPEEAVAHARAVLERGERSRVGQPAQGGGPAVGVVALAEGATADEPVLAEGRDADQRRLEDATVL